ncbi:PKD domain-containing protein [Hyalangium gracile]|uniref:PKD domain-containing protein n=1 Tax=Hyalangium gracile TaxID=394092 RepID=UPI001CCFD540|nr:PKD domain-containing protein [Hyalangium gracile]
MPPVSVRSEAPEAVQPPPVPAPVARPPPDSVATSERSSWEVLAAALHEEMVPLASSVVVEAIERDRPWVCQGEPTALSARLGGVPEPGAVYRWVWLTGPGSAELHPGPTVQWKAPETPGTYAVRFQVCRDLGGRRVGVLAERLVEIDVRPCGAGERQSQEPLRLTVTQRRQGTFLLQALSQTGARIDSYRWDFGDGTTGTTTEPRVEHSFPLQHLGPHDTRSFTVRVEAFVSQGPPLTAMAFVLTRGSPPNDEPSPVELEVSRWSAQPDGGWRSDVVVRELSPDITWDRVERVTRYWDGGVEVATRKWSEGLHVEERLEQGGFRGYTVVSPAESAPGIKQILDFLYGYDSAGQEVVISWSPYKSDAPPVPPEASEPLPAK